MANVTFVKKILSDGSLCKKCHDVSARLESDGVLPLIDQIVLADERDADSPGLHLARKYKVSRAPFFLVEDDHGEVLVFDVYFKLKKHLTELGYAMTETSSL